MDDDCVLPTSTGDEIMELLWQNGQVVAQSQTQMSLKKPQPISQYKYDDAVILVDRTNPADIIRSDRHQHQLNRDHFIGEDQMAAWLHYPLNATNFDRDIGDRFLYPASASGSTSTITACVTSTTTANTSVAPVSSQRPKVSTTETAASSRPSIPLPRREEAVQNFGYFSRHRARVGAHAAESGSSTLISVAREPTVIDSSETPVGTRTESRVSQAAVGRNTSGDFNTLSIGAAETGGASSRGNNINDREILREMTVTSSPCCFSASAEPSATPQKQTVVAEDRKRREREEETEYYHCEDVEFESADVKKQTRGSTSTKKSRASEVHNLSERRRRDRINEKMRALQELIPRCNKSDKASMLDEAIEYLKSLQLQVQMMSMGCSMVPMMFPGIQQYMPPMGMGMGLGMGMEIGINRSMMPSPNVLAGAPVPPPVAAAHLGPRFPMPTFHMPSVPSSDPSRIQAANHSDPVLSSKSTQNPNQPWMPNFVDPYQQYLGLQQMQAPVSQNQAIAPPATSKCLSRT